MARVFEVVQIVGIVHYALAVDFIIAHFHFKGKYIFVHCVTELFLVGKVSIFIRYGEK